MSRLLLIDTSVPKGAVALYRDGVLVAANVFPPEGTHSDHLLPAIIEILSVSGETLDRLDALSVVTGPGSFTGLRVGVGLAKGLGMAAEKPIVPVSSLALLAISHRDASVPVCAMIDARKKEVYAGLFLPEGDGLQTLQEERAISPQDLVEVLPVKTLLVGSGVLCYQEVFEGRSDAWHIPQEPSSHRWNPEFCGQYLEALWGRGGHDSPAAIRPRYLRLSEAETKQG